jgi:hypothetical protein
MNQFRMYYLLKYNKTHIQSNFAFKQQLCINIWKKHIWSNHKDLKSQGKNNFFVTSIRELTFVYFNIYGIDEI